MRAVDFFSAAAQRTEELLRAHRGGDWTVHALARLGARSHAARLGRPAAASSAERGALYVYDVIGTDPFTGAEGVTAMKVRAALSELKGKPLDIFINSPGGSLLEAWAIVTNLQRYAGEKVVHVDGIAASAATLIAMAGDRIITAPHASWMLHKPSAQTMGDDVEHFNRGNLLKSEGEKMAELYASRTGQTIATARELMAAETWLSAQQALELGFTDEIAGARESSSPPARREPPVSSPASRRAVAARSEPIAPRGSCAAETSRLLSHRAAPGEFELQFAADQVARRGYGRLSLRGGIDDEVGRDSTTAGAFAVRLDAMRSAGARTVLVNINSPGGLVTEGLGMARALRRFSAAAGPVIGHVRHAGSMAACVAVACDYLICDFDNAGTFFFHHANGGDEEGRLHADASMLSLLAWRSATWESDLRQLRDREATVHAFAAEELGLIDEVADLARANELARACGRTGVLMVPSTERQRALSARRADSRWR